MISELFHLFITSLQKFLTLFLFSHKITSIMFLKSLFELSSHLVLHTSFRRKDLLLLFKIFCNKLHLILLLIQLIKGLSCSNLFEGLVFRFDLLFATYTLVFYSLQCFFMLLLFVFLYLCQSCLVCFVSFFNLLFIIFKLFGIPLLLFLFPFLFFFV